MGGSGKGRGGAKKGEGKKGEVKKGDGKGSEQPTVAELLAEVPRLREAHDRLRSQSATSSGGWSSGGCGNFSSM